MIVLCMNMRLLLGTAVYSSVYYSIIIQRKSTIKIYTTIISYSYNNIPFRSTTLINSERRHTCAERYPQQRAGKADIENCIIKSKILNSIASLSLDIIIITPVLNLWNCMGMRPVMLQV